MHSPSNPTAAPDDRATADGPHDRSLPFWAPDDATLEAMPPGGRQALADFVQPLVRDHVLQAGNALEKSLGASLAHLGWLEIVEQLKGKSHLTEAEVGGGLASLDCGPLVRYLRLIDAKVRLGRCLIRLTDVRSRQDTPPRRRKDDDFDPEPVDPYPNLSRQFFNQPDSVIRPGQPIPPRVSRP
ncbi:MAG: hypothetical protein ACYC35_24275 [Pirellulales bacterium]